MPTVKIVTDSLADIPPSILRELDITTIPCIVRFGEREYRDRIDLSLNQFYKQLISNSTLPATSQPSVGVFEQVYRDLSAKTSEILSIHVIGSLSGTFNTARLAADNIAGNTKVTIEVIDSHQISMAVGWLVILAARAAKAGFPLAEIKSIVEDAVHRVHLIAMLDTLEYAKRSGRLGKGAALIGTLLNVKPLLSVNRDEVVPVENVRTQKRAIERLSEIVLASGPIQELAVIHAAAERHAQELKQLLSETFPEEQIVLAETGPVLGAHVGPGAVGIAWLTGKY
jgi:DegV family protein with EDD domain